MGCAGGNGLGRRDNPFLIAHFAACWPDTRCYDHHLLSDHGPYLVHFGSRANDTTHPGIPRLRGARQNKIFGLVTVACIGKVGIVH